MRPANRRYLVSAAAALLAFTAAGCQSPSEEPPLLTGHIYIGGKIDQPGFNEQVSHEWRGFEPTFANYLADRLGFEYDFVDVISKEREAVLSEGRVDLVIATYSISGERADKVDFAGPYITTRQGLLIRADDYTMRGYDDVTNKRICLVEGATPDENELRENQFVPRDDYSTCVDDLRGDSEGVDAVFTDLTVLYGFAQKYDDVKVLPGVTLGEENRYGIGLPKGHIADCEKLKEAVRDYLESSRWAADFQAYFGEVVENNADYEHTFKPDPGDVDRYSVCTEDG